MIMITASYDGIIIEIDNYISPKEELDPQLLTCHVCGEKLFIKHGIIKRAHFCHYADTKCEFERLQGEGETLEHHALKCHIADEMREAFPTAEVKLEVPILNRKRIVDVMIAFPLGYKLIIECQCSQISNEEIAERMKDYEQMELTEVAWIFKKGVRAEHDTYILREKCEFVGFADFEYYD